MTGHIDTTGRTQAERESQRNEQYLAEVQQIAHLGNWWWDVVSNETYWSTELFRILGVDPRACKPSRKVFLERVHPDDRPLLEKNLATILSTHEPFSIDHRIVLPDGSIRFVHSVARLEYDAENIPVRIYGIIQDITERQKIEEELRVKERAIASAVSAIGMTDLEGKLVYVNDALVKMWGYESAEAILGESLPGFGEGEDISEAVKDLHGRGWHQGEDLGKRRDGSLFPIEFTASMIEDVTGKPYMVGSFVDITMRKEAEQKFSALLHSAPDAMVIVNDEGNIQLVNRQAEKVFGYAREELVGMGVECLMPERFRGKHVDFRTGYTEAPKTRQMGTGLEQFGLRRDGSEFPIDVSLSPMDTGQGVLVIAALRDVTERKQAEAALKDSRKRLLKAENVARAGFLDWNVKTNEIVWSEGAYELYGIAPGTPVTIEQTVGLIHPEDREFVNENLQMAVKGIRDYDIDHRMVRPDGKVVWVHARADLERDEEGQPTTLMGTVVDITERKAAAEELLQSEERFRHLMQQSPMAIEILSPDGQITEVNTAWMRLWGLNDEAEKAEVMAAYNVLTDPQVKGLGIMPLVEKAFEGERVVLPPIEYSAPRAAEEMGLEGVSLRTAWIQCHLYPIKHANGDIAYVVNTYTDITDLKHAERDARDQMDALARVDRATRLGQLTGSIAHELNQPLTGILSNAQAAELMLESDGWKRDEFAKIMSEIAADTKRAGDVIRGLRELYREHKEDLSPVDVNTVVAETTQLLHSEMVMQQVEFTTECAASLPKVNGNSVQIQQVLVNLIMNGVQAMSSVPRDERLIRVATASEENEVIVWVEDRGPGIDRDKIERIFEPLATWKPGGTGMGLALSNSIIEAHGGKLWAENRPNGGARVGFAIPVHQ